MRLVYFFVTHNIFSQDVLRGWQRADIFRVAKRRPIREVDTVLDNASNAVLYKRDLINYINYILSFVAF